MNDNSSVLKDISVKFVGVKKVDIDLTVRQEAGINGGGNCSIAGAVQFSRAGLSVG